MKAAVIGIASTIVGGFLLAVLIAGVTRCTRTHDKVLRFEAERHAHRTPAP